MMTEFEKECIRWHGRNLTGKYVHYCSDWDYLPIDDTCVEFQSCTCPKLHYQARKKTYNGEVQFELVEAGDTGIPHTNEAVTIRANTKEDLAKWLRHAADDVEKYDVIDGDEGSKDDPSPQNSAKDKPLIDNLLDNFFEGWKV